jgi:hypothetical protein
MAEGLGPKHQPKKHLFTHRAAIACGAENIKGVNTTTFPERVTCTACRNQPEYVDAVARRLVLSRARRPRKATR